jgi:hypothetical protein
LRVGFGKQLLQFIAFGHAAAEHTVSLDHWVSPISRDRRCPFDLSRISFGLCCNPLTRWARHAGDNRTSVLG